MAERSLQTNAADGKQLRFAKRYNERREAMQRGDMVAALEHQPTRRLLMRILFEARCDLAHTAEDRPELSASTYDVSAKIHYHTGRRDLGLLLEGWIGAAIGQTGLLKLALEEAERLEQLAAEVDAAKVSPTTEGAK